MPEQPHENVQDQTILASTPRRRSRTPARAAEVFLREDTATESQDDYSSALATGEIPIPPARPKRTRTRTAKSAGMETTLLAGADPSDSLAASPDTSLSDALNSTGKRRTSRKRATLTNTLPGDIAPDTSVHPTTRPQPIVLPPSEVLQRTPITSPQPIVPPDPVIPETITVSEPLFPSHALTRRLDDPSATQPGVQLDRITRPVRPVHHGLLSQEESQVTDAYKVVIIPGAHAPETHPRLAPVLPLTSRNRSHRHVLIGLVVVMLMLVASVIPLSRALGAGNGRLAAGADIFAIPTNTATPTPPPPLYPDHPVVGGAGNFICTALPFARLARQRMEETGLPHPWYVSVILAQWGVEQGWSMPTYTGYNFGNVSAISGFASIGGINVPGSPGAFAYAYTPMQGVDMYVVFSHMGFYSGVADAYPRGPIAQAIAIGQSPWDADHYALGGQVGAKLVNAINNFDLTRYDDPNAGCG